MPAALENRLEFEKPPIFEVICGIHFSSVEKLDALSQGLFWANVRDDFPAGEVKAPLSPPRLKLSDGPPRIRSWLKSEKDDFLIQLQDDRFYLNWRRSDQEYPRFGSVDEPKSIVSEMLKRFEQFSNFCRDSFSVDPDPELVEVAKINILPKGDYWNSLSDLGEIVPALSGLTNLLSDQGPQVSVRFESTTEGAVHTEIETVKLINSESKSETDAVRVEIRTREPVGDSELTDSLIDANVSLNHHFLRLFPTAESTFSGGPP